MMDFNLHQAQSHDILRSWQCQRNDVNHHKDFVLPMFIGNDDDACQIIESMPDVNRYGVNTAIEYLEPLVYSFGLRAVLLFPVVMKSERDHLDRSEPDEEEDARSETISSSSSSESATTSSSEEDEPRQGKFYSHQTAPVVAPLLATTGADKEGTHQTGNASQNPFLSQNEEEDEDHLLGEETSKDEIIAASLPVQLPQPPPPPPRDQGTLRKKMRELDVKLIKGMALKDKYNPVLRLIPKLRAKFPELLIICDVCLCAFTSTGHCCLFEENDDSQYEPKQEHSTTSGNHHHLHHHQLYNQLESGGAARVGSKFPTISNKITCQYLAMLAVEYALRGCNVVAPSDMMDGRILTIRERLNENRLQNVSIMSYSAKFASAFYGPFRQATNNAPEFGDRRAYQLPPGSRALALKSVARDIRQGADFIMVKPAGAYLDIVRDIREQYKQIPIAVYQVSGEYSMLKLAAKANLLDLRQAVNESLTAFRRAGATIIITYFTPELLKGEL